MDLRTNWMSLGIVLGASLVATGWSFTRACAVGLAIVAIDTALVWWRSRPRRAGGVR